MRAPGATRRQGSRTRPAGVVRAAHILVVEDDDDLRSATARYLAREGFAVSEAGDGHEALAMLLDPARQARPWPLDAVVLDLLLPGLNGREVCYRLRGAGCRVPVLMATASGEVEDRVQGFHDGADDYVVKPVSLAELVVRLYAILRRTSVRAEALLAVGDLRVDLAGCRAWRADAEIALSRREADLLALLMRRPGIVLSRGSILRSIWGDAAAVSSNALDQYVAHLRRKIDRPFDRADIETVPGVGYRLRAPG